MQETLQRVTNPKGKKYHVIMRRQEIANRMKKLGKWNIDRKSLAKEFGVSPYQIDKDLRYIKDKGSVPLDVQEYAVEINEGLKELIAQARDKSLNADTEASRRQWSNTYARLVDQAAKSLEDFHIKAKPVEGHMHLVGVGSAESVAGSIVDAVLSKHLQSQKSQESLEVPREVER